MKTILSILIKILIALFILIVLLVIFRNPVAKAGAQIGARVALGAPLSVEKIDINLAKSFLLIKELRVGNPAGIPEGEMFHMPEFYVDYNFGDLLKNKIHLEEVRIDIDHFTVSKNQQGKDTLQVMTEKGKSKEPAEKKEAPKETSKKSGKAPEVKIDKLSVKFGKVNFVDYSKNISKPEVKEIKLNLNKHYEKLDNPYFILGTLTLEILAKSGLAGLTNIDLGFVKGFADDALKTSLQFAGQATDEASKALKNATGQVTKLTEDASVTAEKATAVVSDAAKELTGSVKNLKEKLKLPFGKEE